MNRLEELKHEIAALDEVKESFPGQKAEYRRSIIIKAAVAAADELIMEGSDGSVEETDYLTTAVALKFVEKGHQANSSKLLRKQIHGDKHGA